MAVYEKTFRPYGGALTPRWSRFLVVRRYAASQVFASKITTALFALSFAFPLGAALVVYLRYNVGALGSLGIDVTQLPGIDVGFFRAFLLIQTIAGYLFTVLAGPGLVSPDLAHGALPLYLSRPLSRWEYTLGKLLVLALPLSLLTWVPGLLLVLLQTYLEDGWLASHLRLPVAVFVGSWVAILVLSLAALALSAWVRWRPVAAGLLVAALPVTLGFAGVVNASFGTRWGDLGSPGRLIYVVWKSLFTGEAPVGEIPLWGAWLGLAGLGLLCLGLLRRRLVALEVVR